MFRSSMGRISKYQSNRFFSQELPKVPRVLYVSVESEKKLTGLYNQRDLARKIADQTPYVSIPVALARAMRHDMISHIKCAVEWRKKAYPEDENLLTVITTHEGMYHTPPEREFMLTQEILHDELILPIKEFMMTQSITTSINFGTFGVLVDNVDSNFKPATYAEIEMPTSGETVWLNQPPKSPISNFANLAIYGNGGPEATVDYYTKRNVWLYDNYKDQYQQMYDTTKPNIFIQKLDGKNVARIFKICLDSAYSFSDDEIVKFLASMGLSVLPEFGTTEILSYHGARPDKENLLYDLVFMSEGAEPKKSGVYDMNKTILEQGSPNPELREYISYENEKWPVNARLYPYRPVNFGRHMAINLESEVGIMDKLKAFFSPKW